jgi:NDP-mannose synthase
MSKRAIIMAGGKGTRLRPYTSVLPKPMMPIGEYPIVELVIRQLIKEGFDHITLSVNHQAEIIKAYFEGGDKLGVKLDYILEDTPLGTMGSLSLIKDLPENFLVMNGDILTDLKYGDLYDSHINDGSIFTISSSQRESKIDYGVLSVDDKTLISLQEKPVQTYEVSMGVYVANSMVVEHIEKNVEYGFDRLMSDLILNGHKPQVRNHNGYWLDIGRPNDYMKAIDDYEEKKGIFTI